MHSRRIVARFGLRSIPFAALLAALAGFASCDKEGSVPESAESVELASHSEELLPELGGLRVHLDALDITGVADGAAVPSWAARVGTAATQLTQGGTTIAAPTYVTSSSVMNGRPALRFGKSAASALQFSVASGGGVATSNQLTVTVVGSR